jgi:hypothetical protein
LLALAKSILPLHVDIECRVFRQMHCWTVGAQTAVLGESLCLG